MDQGRLPSTEGGNGASAEGKNLKSQQYLDQINNWTDNHKMVISEKKTKAMIFNFTENFQFTTRLELKGRNIEMVDKMRILGTIVRSDLSWDENCELLIKKVNARMQLLRGVQGFGASTEEMVHLWIIFCRSVLEQSCVVWSSSLTQDNKDDLERTQKTFTKLVLKEKYKNYEDSLRILNLDSLEIRRNDLHLKFAQSGIKNDKLNDLFPLNDKNHKMQTRNNEKYEVMFANTNIMKNGSIITMQNMLNNNEMKK